MAFQNKFRKGTASAWSSTNPTLKIGEVGVVYDTPNIKIGNGSAAWNSLSFLPVTQPAQTQAWKSFGDGGDGNVTISSGTTTLSRDMYYNNLTLSGTGQLVTNGYKIFVKGILDLTSAPANAINWNGASGGNASGSTGGSIGTAQTNAALGAGQSGGAGATGGTGAGAAGTAPSAGTNGGGSNNSGAGGTGVSAGGASSGGATPTNSLFLQRWETQFIRGVTLSTGGCGGRGGSSGGGDGTNTGGGGGAGGNGGGIVAIYANTIVTSSSTTSGCIASLGGAGGNGGTVSTGTVGGGGGGSGGGGGWIYLAYAYKYGPAITNLISVNGGAGGSGGMGIGSNAPTLIAGGGAAGGNSGRITVFNILTQIGSTVVKSATAATNPEVVNVNTTLPENYNSIMSGQPGDVNGLTL
jgi:Major tropism determinant N-terminal domain